MRMNELSRRVATPLLAALVLQGCAAAAMVRDRPDFEEEPRRMAPMSFQQLPALQCRADSSSG